jgi:cyclic-di-GMP-binding protein
MPSFDVVSEINEHELANAVDQASRELAQRFDFKGTNAKFELEESTVTMSAPADFQLKQMLDILKLKITKRGIDVACLEIKDPEINLATAKQLVVLRHGIDQETGKKMQRMLKDSKLKVQAQIQGDKLRVTGKQRDDLQAAIALLRAGKLELPLQFNNFRD